MVPPYWAAPGGPDLGGLGGVFGCPSGHPTPQPGLTSGGLQEGPHLEPGVSSAPNAAGGVLLPAPAFTKPDTRVLPWAVGPRLLEGAELSNGGVAVHVLHWGQGHDGKRSGRRRARGSGYQPRKRTPDNQVLEAPGASSTWEEKPAGAPAGLGLTSGPSRDETPHGLNGSA